MFERDHITIDQEHEIVRLATTPEGDAIGNWAPLFDYVDGLLRAAREHRDGL